MVSDPTDVSNNKSYRNPYFLEYEALARGKNVGNIFSTVWAFTVYQLKKIWPYIYKFINGGLFDLLRLLKTAVKYAVRQITEF